MTNGDLSINKKLEPLERELPNTHFYHVFLPVLFMIVWVCDSFIFSWTVWLNEFVPSIIRIVLFIIILCMGLIFIQIAHKKLFDANKPSDTLLTTGILAHIRNPMYFGIVLFYIALIFLSISVISIILFCFIFLVYNKMVSFEENIMDGIFGQEYRDYKNKVPKWIPSLRKKI